MQTRPNDHYPAISTRRRYVWAAGGMLLLLLMGACTGSEEGTPPVTEEPEQTNTESTPTNNPTPTVESTPTSEPTPDYTDLSSLESAAQDTPEGTFELYLRDAIAQQVSLQREKLDLRLRYQEPTTLVQDLGGLVLNVELIEDRSKISVLRETSATYEVDIDVRITFADLDTSTQTCMWTLNLEKAGDYWYVVNPKELLLFVNCTS